MNNLVITNPILNSAYLDYIDKCKEVNDFFTLIDFLESTKNISVMGNDKISAEEKQIVLDRSLIGTIQSSSFYYYITL